MNESKKEQEVEELIMVEEGIEGIFERIVTLIREEFVATFQKESHNALLMRSVGGKTFRVQIEEVI